MSIFEWRHVYTETPNTLPGIFERSFTIHLPFNAYWVHLESQLLIEPYEADLQGFVEEIQLRLNEKDIAFVRDCLEICFSEMNIAFGLKEEERRQEQTKFFDFYFSQPE